MKRPVLVAALAVIAAAVMLLAYYLIAGRAPAPSVGVIYFSAGASPAPLQAIGYVERGQLYSTVTIGGQAAALGRGLTPELRGALAGLIANSTMKFGSPNAPVVVVEYLDPTCPYCAVFSAAYFNYLLQYINNGTVLYVIRYFPTHVLGYLQPGGYYPQAFNAGVESWLSLECIYKRHGPAAALNATEGMYEVAAYYLSAYMQTNNSTYLLIYPIAEKRYLESRYPDCAYNLPTDQLEVVVAQAERQITAEAKALGIPNEMLGTPLFVVFPRP
ncbi:MAG: thioredoxin domain-containing protein [Thermoproteus sp.]|nr:thioredoxin domain-containing protein [Thermoproteus sp.]